MNFIEELVKELRDENLLDEIEYVPFGQKRDSNIFQFNQKGKINLSNNEFSGLNNSEFLVNQSPLIETNKNSEGRYSINSIQMIEPRIISKPRVRLIKKNGKLTRVCKRCDSNVFVFDAFCPNCNERLIGNFLYYLFFIVSGIMIGFMIFFMATSNPY
ncbi:MAG TPA: hypothetical protein PKY82_29105 [Pyrinomonadaceae bacterium]|nr:hypothetical protein [Pyrinomonadaceae bacterium]